MLQFLYQSTICMTPPFLLFPIGYTVVDVVPTPSSRAKRNPFVS